MNQFACRNLEHSMARCDVIMKALMQSYGRGAKEDYTMLNTLANVVQCNFAMLATISRASRSYSIGLRNADMEVCNTKICILVTV